jgi:AcrR family transcriptional regulator
MARPRSDIRTRVLHAARERFLNEGVDGASLRRIAKDAKTSIGMVYYYFPTKDDLFLGIVEEVYQVVLADLLDALDPSRSVEDRIRGLYARVGGMSDDERLVVRLVLREALVSSSRLDSILERFKRGHVPLMLQLVMDGIARGVFQPGVHPLSIAATMMALGGPAQLLHRVIGPRMPGSGVPEGGQLSELMARILLNGVGKKPQGGAS